MWIGGASLFAGQLFHLELWTIEPLGTLILSIDRLSGLFIFVTGLVMFPASIFAAAILDQYAGHYSLRAFSASYFALFASVVLIPLSADVLSFLLLWESMSILTYLLVNYEQKEAEHTRSGYVMLAVGEGGTIAIALAFLILANNGALDFSCLRLSGIALGESARWAVFLLSFFGFAVKAGLVPVNFWLPQAYTAAPAAFVPVLAGATLNLGLYGIARVNIDLLPISMVGPGLVALIIGTVSALLGILYATTQNDLKTVLAHSSIENAGIITAALGAGFIFLASGFRSAAAIAFVTAFYQMINHSLYKTLLFFGAGSVDQNAHTRNLDLLGGLIKAMPWTALFFLVGALSIAGLPPFNGFVSEWLTLQTLLISAALHSTSVKIAFALCGAGLALTFALAVTCFVKAFAMGFLGMSRSEQAKQTHEARISVTAPMAILAVLCVILGVTPTYVIPVLGRTIAPMTHASAADALVPAFFDASPHHGELPAKFVEDFRQIGAQVGQSILPGRGLVILHQGAKANPVVFAMSTAYTALILLLMLAVTFVVVRLIVARERRVTRRTVWDGGIRLLRPEMTYTATGFSNPVRVIFASIFRPTTVEDTRETVAEHFRSAIRRTRQENHVLDRLVLNPIADGALWVANGFARMHHGFLNAYVVYGLSALIVALLIARFSS